MFIKFIGTKKKEKAIGDQILSLWFRERCSTNNEGKRENNMDKLWEEFPMKYLKRNTSMIVLEGDDVQSHPSENYTFHKPFKTLSAKEDSHMIHGI